MTLNTIVYINMQYIIIDQIKDSSNQLCSTTIVRTPISCDLFLYNYTTTIWNVTLLNSACIVSSLQLLFWDLYEFRNEPLLTLSNPNFIVCIYSCLYHVHVYSPANLLKSLHDVRCFPCQGFSLSSLLLLKCTSSSHSPVSLQLRFRGLLTSLL